ncbi:hypothetical protein PLICRDRAFT_119974 [Plicaturopsis crispa FD-325 SS-3]|uniref:CxC1-like cysteine cluster associated with KDZ transposases domain-containing protein n=1 Tax=Plicaturopsis crispa FD-325 SS-3 TaxID=944288 RepID=A0A0C9SVE3_PLICR|nr:hypothetical protein PLICRDRAFT_119974 [Plicaturopsis crispa FD-325 SS-3]
MIVPGRVFTQTTRLPLARTHSAGASIPDDPFLAIAGDQADVSPSGLNAEVWGVDGRVKAGEKKKRQWTTWATQIIPGLVDPHLRFLRRSENLRTMPTVAQVQCTCDDTAKRRTLSISCVSFDNLQKIDLVVCPCRPAATQLLNRGLFPCAPHAPTLAVDLRMLEFVTNLFVRMAPNSTAWCDTLETFLDGRGYKLDSRNSMRRRFNNALVWYSSLVNASRSSVGNYLEEGRGAVLAGRDEGEVTREPSPAAEDRSRRATVEEIEDEEDNGADSEPSRSDGVGESDTATAGSCSRPSEYLRGRCPLCFGGKNWHDPNAVADTIACLDACFTQKRRKTKDGQRDAHRAHPDTVFMPEEDVEAMRDFVQKTRGSTKTRRGPPAPENSEGDTYERGLRVPNSVLDECKDSFGAADEKREAASTQFFVDTGLMGLLCRHDRVLWLINMTTAGERQYYALALIKRLFEHLPQTMTVGILYDIGCQLHRSCVKWNFLDDIRDRITFGIAVFHAYGHQWACQIIYHPRKCVGFGLTDGEGCERFWSAIKKLIPVLRVSGYHQRLFVLDTQVKYLDDKSLHGLGLWLARRWLHCQRKKSDATQRLRDCGISDDVLRREWDAQVNEQTKPAPRRSKNRGKIAVDKILAMQKSELEYREAEAALEEQLQGEYDQDVDANDIAEELTSIRQRRSALSANIRGRIAALGATDRANLQQLATNEYVRVRMNARALKKRIRDRLRQRKFELERLEREYRHTVNEKNLRSHTKERIRTREPGILSLAKSYNALCDQLVSLIRRGRALPGAIAPTPIAREGLFKLDVDDDIWQDIGLDEEDSTLTEILGWLGDENIRDGIRARLDLDRCLEEEERIKGERCSMQEWMLEEWAVLQDAQADAINDGGDMLYQLELREEYLRRVCVTWERAVRPLPCKYPMPESWGPSLAALVDTAALEATASYLESDDDDGDYDSLGELSEDDDDAELLEIAEETALTDAYRSDRRTATEKLGLNLDNDVSSSPVRLTGSSSRKRARFE